MIVNGFFPIGEIPVQEGTNDASDNEGGTQGGDFSLVLFLILADPAAKSAQVTCDLELSLPPVTSDDGSSDGSILPQRPGSCGVNQDVIDVPAKPANPQADNLAREFTGEQTAPMNISSADAANTQFAPGATITVGNHVELDPTPGTRLLPDQITGSRDESAGPSFASSAQLTMALRDESKPILRDVVITSFAHRPGEGGARNGIAAYVPRNLLPRSVIAMVGQSVNGQPNALTVTAPKDLVSENEILKPEVVSVVTPPAQFPGHVQQPITLQPRDVGVVLDMPAVKLESNSPSSDARVAQRNLPRQPQGFPLDDSDWMKDSLDNADFAVRGEHRAPGDEVLRLGRQLQAQVKHDSHGRTLSETIGGIGDSGSPDARRGHPGLNLQHGVRAPFPEPHEAPDEHLHQVGGPYHATSLANKTSKAAAREVEPGRWLPLVERVAGEINGHIRIGKQEAIMQLDPPELGKLRIDLRLDGDRLEARILAETPESRAIIETHLHELRRMLGENRVELVNVRIDSGNWSSAGGEGHGSPRQDANGGHQPTNDFGGALQGGAKERELGPGQPQAHDPGRVSMWA